MHSFLGEFVRAPFTVGAVAPSGRPISDRMAVGVPETGDPLVAEIGPGTGAFTAALQRRLAGRGHHVGVEINERFARVVRGRFPAVDVVTGDARHLAAILAERGHGPADVIVSGLPWTTLGREPQARILDAVVAALAPHGAFTTIAYAHMRWTGPARRFRALLDDRFEEVVPGRMIWANTPPAFVYHCRRPRTAIGKRTP